MATLTETGLENVVPVRIDLTGDNAAFVYQDYFQQFSFQVEGDPATDWDLSGITAWYTWIKERPDDADSAAIGAGSVTDTSSAATGDITLHFPRSILVPASAGRRHWSLHGAAGITGYIVPIAYGIIEIEEMPTNPDGSIS